MGKRIERQHPGSERTGMLTPGNDHLGRSIWAFTIPAVISCTHGMTVACTIACYALNFLFMVKANLDFHERNFKRAQSAPEQFAKDMILEIRFKKVKKLRIHVAGDFFSLPYIQAWIKMARACKRTTFVFYTRSWRESTLVPPLLELAGLPNVWAWWSEDRDTGPCHLPFGRRCFLVVDDEDLPLVPQDAELVFRDKPRYPLKWVGQVWVCPKEQLVPHGITCEVCEQCFVPGPMPRGQERATQSLFPVESADG